jgi:hypothetical protein
LATEEYMTSQTYDIDIGATVYSVTVSMGNTVAATLPANTATADDTSPTVLGVNILYLPANTVATAITQLDNGASNQMVILVCTSSTNSPTIADGGNFALNGNWSPNADDTLTLISQNGSAWREICRSAN